jgi:hypothetical protein
MPVPYNLTIQVDIWTTNTDTKLQILEQLFVIFNPSIQLQSNDNPLDWTSVFEVELTDINWSSRSIPAGVDENLDISTLNFMVPIWISPPAKVKRQTIIQQIVADVHKVTNINDLGYSQEYYDFFGSMPVDAEIVITPNDYRVQVTGATAKLVRVDGVTSNWADLIEMKGELTATSLLKLNTANSIAPEDEVLIVGSVTASPVDPTVLIFNIDQDTLPADTLPPIDKIIDPRTSSPGNGLAPAVLGQRYLITEAISASGYPAWGVDANESDIIQYNGSVWQVAFNSSAIATVQFVTNSYTSKQFKWTGSAWISSYEGEYNPGYWRLVL